MNTTAIGQRAERVAAQYLIEHGYKILSMNWRTRWCEIDIVAYKNNCAYFVEVKYRHSDKWGSGLDYITPKKLQQMQFAADFWVTKYSFEKDVSLCAIELVGRLPKVKSYLKNITT